ncbi:MAG TPA: cyclic pyranopterin monophosphate synthase MoaC [Acidobacteriota bacterium]|nr:cyclic pyranopterin monophosphate synthase MoaC [Acidobacteriota bacterium]
MATEPTAHQDNDRARMVDVGPKEPTHRRARAVGRLCIAPATLTAIAAGRLPKGNPFEAARLAGISAAKKTADLIPLCHPLRLSFVDVTVATLPDAAAIEVTAVAEAHERTGVEMEALTACGIALLTIYDMLKAIDGAMTIEALRLVEKTGGKSDYRESARET